MVSMLSRFDEHPFLLDLGPKTYKIGDGPVEFRVRLNKLLSLRDLLNSTTLTLGEAYMRGDLEIEGDLYEVLDKFMSQFGKFSLNIGAMKNLLLTNEGKTNQKQEVQSHYDIGNDFYELWLDPTLSYSCAYFENEDDDLETAQKKKIDRILKKLYLKEGMTLLDIGCGWGELLIEAAKKYGVKGMGITLSEEQFLEFNKRIESEGLQDLLEVHLMDYRDLPQLGKQFDRIVSVGMIEHVGRDNYPLFMKTCTEVLKPGGLFLLHFISGMTEHPGDPWIKKYIFPGGVIPSLREILVDAAEDDLHVLDVENLRVHYKKTLLNWLKNFNENRDTVEEMMGTEFSRMWELYLAACAALFENGGIELHQILFSKGINKELPDTRWY